MKKSVLFGNKIKLFFIGATRRCCNMNKQGDRKFTHIFPFLMVSIEGFYSMI